MSTAKKFDTKAPYIFTHGERKKDSGTFAYVTKTAKVAPDNLGRKAKVLFAGKNPNGALARLKAAKIEVAAETPLADAVAFIERFSKIAGWPIAPKTDAAIATVEKAIADAAKADAA